MKKLIPFMVLLIGATAAFGQVVNFNNFNLADPPARRVLISDMMTPLVGSPTAEPATFVAQLYYGAMGTPADSLIPVTSAVARFRTAASGPGQWLGGLRTLTGFQVGDIVTLQVRAWDANRTGRTYVEARNDGRDNQWGDSLTFTYKVASGTAVPSDQAMEAFRGFSLVPEPSVIGLGLIGVGALFLLRRRKA